MHCPMSPKLSKWPFLLSDVLLLGLAFLIVVQARLPLGPWEVVSCTLCVTVGAGCAALPFILEYRALLKLILADRLITVTSEIQKLGGLADQISSATSQWETVQESAAKTAGLAQAIAEQMAAEVREFQQSFQQANEAEKSALRLEVEKLQRAENDWLQVLVRTLDHVYAVHQAAVRSRQPSLIDQLGQFQNACREAARRVGLTPFVAAPEEPFDKQIHQPVDGDSDPGPEAAVEETVATGYTFQGRLLRPALVRLRNGNGAAPADSRTGPKTGQSQLPLEPPSASV